jgi:hypothetical protein
MQIDGIISHAPKAYGLEKVKYNESASQPQNDPTLSDDEVPVEHTAEEDGAKGVLRLLQEGHFKGVADVRLRINFHDELAAIEQAQLRTSARENTAPLIESTQAIVQTLIDSGQITQESADQANDELKLGVNQAVHDFLTGQITTKEDLVARLGSVFDAFIALLNAGIISPEQTSSEPTDEIPPDQTEQVNENVEQQESPVEETGVTEGSNATPEQPAVQDAETEQSDQTPAFVTELTTVFNAAMEQFLGTISEVNALPELSPPTGKGVAYQKFLEIYNELYGLTAEVPPEPEAVIDAAV